MTQSQNLLANSAQHVTPLTRAKALAERIVTSMKAQGYFSIEYILTEGQLKIVASNASGGPKTLYLTLSELALSAPCPVPVPAQRDRSHSYPH